ncbi:Transcription termination/antitermination protein NusA [Anaerohalosphaera lusitana]|uniref:Transcription termination/antitermination protein NusA n=1 Tax=Anaerohalosphaera lusitana TaxID=1936003 RepID=A0A1U9NIQ4_9BACT|nr:transcription termination factor NusA [Anaerohalosphaera lusitana]AQT67667.1 Transcription termination/antitermination protein NusA [Anaerohalosphaera lusitana]
MSQELIRIVENIARDKNIDKESIFADLEAALVSAARKAFSTSEETEIEVFIDRDNGNITAYKDGEKLDVKRFGRIAAQTAKQVMIQKLKADERESIFAEYVKRKGEAVNGSIARFEGGTMVIDLSNRVEAIMPKSEQIGGETHHVGERLRCMILDVREVSSQVRIILSRTHPDFIKRLFELEVPEVTEGIIEIKALAREAGYRTKIAVESHDDKVDAVGACVGVRGSRIRNIVDELSGEKIDIVRWSDSSQTLIANALKPAEVSEIAICFELGRATVVVTEDQLSLAIGKHGQNVRLAARLTSWDIDILTPEEYNAGVERLAECVTSIEGVDDSFVDQLLALGIISVLDLEEVGSEPLIEELGVDEDTAVKAVELAENVAKEIASEKKQAEDILEQEQARTEDEDEDEDTEPGLGIDLPQ